MIRVARWAWATGAVVLIAAVGTGVTAAVDVGAHASRPEHSQEAGQPHASRKGDATTGLQNPAKPTTPSDATPVSVQIPSIRVNARLESLHKDATGALNPPQAWDDAGWYANGVVPGQVGPAVIAGHVDSLTSAAVFYDLDELAPGDTVQVSMSDGQKLVFTVRTTVEASKHAFPTSEVYAATPDPELRLITCGGPYDPAWGHYTENLIVFAVLTSS
jgi:sortase (surface protein transpeptidase)